MASAVNVGDALVPLDPRAQPVRFSHLKHLAKSPAHYLHSLTADSWDSRPMRVGMAVHAKLLGGSYVVYDGERRGKDWSAFLTINDGARILTASEDADARAIAGSVMATPAAMELLGGHHELELDWTGIGGRRCRSHVDACSRRHNRVVELKVTNNAEPVTFGWHSWRMLYHAQLAWYRDAIEQAQGWRARDAYIVAVEDKAPYVVTCRHLTERSLIEGASLCRGWMETLAACEASGRWPGYCADVLELDIPIAGARAGALFVDGEDAA